MGALGAAPRRVIQALGSAMAGRDALNFAQGFQLTDDPANNATVVTATAASGDVVNPHAAVTRSSTAGDQALGAGVSPVTWDTLLWDYAKGGGAPAGGSEHWTAANATRMYVRDGGLYALTASLRVTTSAAANPSGTQNLRIRLNGTTLIGPIEERITSGRASMAIQHRFAVGDYVELVIDNSGNTTGLVIAAADPGPTLRMVRVSA